MPTDPWELFSHVRHFKHTIGDIRTLETCLINFLSHFMTIIYPSQNPILLGQKEGFLQKNHTLKKINAKVRQPLDRSLRSIIINAQNKFSLRNDLIRQCFLNPAPAGNIFCGKGFN